MIENKRGRVIFLSSLAGRISIPFLGPYCASKFAIEGFASSLRKEMKKLDDVNIQIGIIEPGAYATGFNKENNEKKYEWMYKDSYFKHNFLLVLYLLEFYRKEKFQFYNKAIHTFS